MQNSKGSYEKTALLIAGLIAIGTAGYLIWDSQSFPERLQTRAVKASNELNPPPFEKVNNTIARLTQKITWTAPTRVNKPIPLNKSVLLVLKGDQLFDLFVETPVYREPMTNAFLVKYDLPDLLSPNVGALDADQDGFSNEEEFLKNTNPRDPNDRPPVTDKLFLKQRITHDYILKLNSSASPFQIQRIAPEPKASKFANLGEEFGFERGVVRFKLESFEQKIVPDPKTGEKDVSELTMTDLATDKKFVLVRGVDHNLAEYEAELEFRLGPPPYSPRQVKKDDTFQIPGFGVTYKLLEIEEDGATIAPVKADGSLDTPITIKRS